MEFTEEDIAPEDFILLWYEIDVDHDEYISQDACIGYLQKYPEFSWMTYDEIKTEIWDKIDEDQNGVISFD